MIRVMIIGSVRLYCDGLAMTLDGRQDIAVVATSTGDDASVERVRSLSPDVIVIDVLSSDLMECLRVIRRECAPIKVVAFAIHEDSDSLIKCAEAGVSGYVTCDASVDELAMVIQTVAREQFVCPPQIAATLLRRLASHGETLRARVEPESLTVREQQVLGLICEGLSNKEIAHVCGISEATVKNHVHNLLEKRRLKTRGQLAARAALDTVSAARRSG